VDADPATDTDVSDAALVLAARAGQAQAFAELYRRHAEAAWRVALAVTGNPNDAADAVSESFARLIASIRRDAPGPGAAFRAYLLATTRNAAIDILRRGKRVTPAPAEELPLPPGPAEPADALLAAEEAGLVAQAFADLPERWRSVLWLTEVEGYRPSEVAGRLGLTPNGAAQLAVRARAGLRERYLQAHLRAQTPAACRFTLEHLGAYVGGGIATRDLAKVDQHLAECAACRARLAELQDVRSTLRRVLLPLPFGLAALSFRRWREALLAAAARTPGGGWSSLRRAHRALASASAALFVAGVIGAGLKGDGSQEPGRPAHPTEVGGFTLARPPAPASSEAPPVPALPPLPDALPVVPPEQPAPAPARPTAPPAPPTAPPAQPGPAPSAPGSTATVSGPAGPATAEPVVQVTAGVSDGAGGITVAVGLGEGGCTGIGVGAGAAGCAPEPSPHAGVEVTTGGSALPPVRVQVP
jgi:RNA polymerase sigma factor (sigma-70 family)